MSMNLVSNIATSAFHQSVGLRRWTAVYNSSQYCSEKGMLLIELSMYNYRRHDPSYSIEFCVALFVIQDCNFADGYEGSFNTHFLVLPFLWESKKHAMLQAGAASH